MAENDWLVEQFEENRTRLKAVAYRMLGSLTEADDAVQEAWLRLSRSDYGEIENLPGWLTTVVARVSLNMLRSRRTRREESIDDVRVPEPILDRVDERNPEHEALIADSVGLALLVVLETLSPAERLAFVLHDMFAVPFDDIAPIVDRSPEAVRQLASRARRRVRNSPEPDADISAQRKVVDAFMAASRDGDFEGLLALLDPDVVLRADMAGGVTQLVRGAQAVASRAKAYSRMDLVIQPALVNGAIGAVATKDGQPFSVMGCTVRDGKIVAMDILADPERLSRLDLSMFED
jgi:RNA polymerase sigma-70 factor (ECF subfamily)